MNADLWKPYATVANRIQDEVEKRLARVTAHGEEHAVIDVIDGIRTDAITRDERKEVVLERLAVYAVSELVRIEAQK